MYAFVIFLLFRLNKIDDKWLRHQKKDNVTVYEVKKQKHKNMYYDILYNDDSSDELKNDISIDKNTDDEKTNWQKAETNDIVYEHDKVDMNMFRDDQEN